MKNKLEIGSQTNINAAFEDGAIDTSVIYSVPLSQANVIEVNAHGIVTALSIGTATVEIKDAETDLLLRAIVIQVLSAEDFATQTDLDTGETDLQIEILDINRPINVSGTDAGNDYVNVTFANTVAVTNRVFQVGIRAVGSSASSTSDIGRFEYQNSTFSGQGPHTVELLSSVADGVYEVYVQDLTSMVVAYALVTVNTEDSGLPYGLQVSRPVGSYEITATWSTTTSVINRTFQVGIRETNSSASATNATGRIAYVTAGPFSGTGPFSCVVTFPDTYNLPTQPYYPELYVQDLTTNELASTSFTMVYPRYPYQRNPWMSSNTTRYPDNYESVFADQGWNGLPNGVVSASSTWSASYPAYFAFDGSNATSWWSGVGVPQWIQYDFEKETTVHRYALRGNNGGSSHPKDWQFQGSQDGTNWVTLDTQTNQPVLDSVYLSTYYLPGYTDVSYRYYRLYVTALGVNAAQPTPGNQILTINDIYLSGWNYY